MKFDFVASTGRTATTFLASLLNAADGVVACHEGYVGSDKNNEPLLPLINLENAQAYARPASGKQIVTAKRSVEILTPLVQTQAASHLIDVAYYYPTIAHELMKSNPQTRMLGLIRTCEDFVRSATTLTGEDTLPVGWPDPDKILSEREKFISLGRIKPRKGTPDKEQWSSWSAIRRNIWLWKETNLLLIKATQAFPDRTRLCRFETLRNAPHRFYQTIGELFQLPVNDIAEQKAKISKRAYVNKKTTGYQIGPASDWTQDEQSALTAGTELIEEMATYDC